MVKTKKRTIKHTENFTRKLRYIGVFRNLSNIYLGAWLLAKTVNH